MRIIGGRFKGKKLRAPSNIPARPTTDFARESLFNILQNRIDWESTFLLDLFCGIGSLSLEAISRGANMVVSIDQNFHAIKWLNKCKIDLDINNLKAFKSESIKWLYSAELNFDLIFADPPYEYAEYEKLISLVLEKSLKQGALFVLEHRQSISFANHPHFLEDRTYGEVKFTFFTNTK